jgi:hypothetical protein
VECRAVVVEALVVGRLAYHKSSGLDDKVRQEQVAEMGKRLGSWRKVFEDCWTVGGQVSVPVHSIDVEMVLQVAPPHTGCHIGQQN